MPIFATMYIILHCEYRDKANENSMPSHTLAFTAGILQLFSSVNSPHVRLSCEWRRISRVQNPPACCPCCPLVPQCPTQIQKTTRRWQPHATQIPRRSSPPHSDPTLTLGCAMHRIWTKSVSGRGFRLPSTPHAGTTSLTVRVSTRWFFPLW